jgi:hypothetical protein
LALLGTQKYVILWFLALSGVTFAVVTYVRRTIASNNLLTGRFDYLRFLMGSIFVSSGLFALAQLYRELVVERAGEASTIEDLEGIVDRLQSLLFVAHWPAATSYASVVIAVLILALDYSLPERRVRKAPFLALVRAFLVLTIGATFSRSLSRASNLSPKLSRARRFRPLAFRAMMSPMSGYRGLSISID